MPQKKLLTCTDHNCILKKTKELKRRTCTGFHYEERRRLLGERDHHITPEFERVREGRTGLAAYTLDQGYQKRLQGSCYILLFEGGYLKDM